MKAPARPSVRGEKASAPAAQALGGAAPPERPQPLAAGPEGSLDQRLERADRLGHHISRFPLAPLPPVPPLPLAPALRISRRALLEGAVQRTEYERLTFTPTLQSGKTGAAESGVAGGGALWAVNPETFQASLDYRVQGSAADADQLEVGLVQNAVQDDLKGTYRHSPEAGKPLERELTFGPTGDLPLLDGGDNSRPFYDASADFKLLRDGNAAIDETIAGEIQMEDKPTFAIPYEIEDPQSRKWRLRPATLAGNRLLDVWIGIWDKSRTWRHLAGRKWWVTAAGAVGSGAGNFTDPPVLDGELASTSGIEIKDFGSAAEVG